MAKHILRTYIPCNPYKYDRLEEALEEAEHLQYLQPENIYFVDGKQPDLEQMHVCRRMLIQSNWANVHYQPLMSLVDWLMQHRNEVMRFYFGQEE